MAATGEFTDTLRSQLEDAQGVLDHIDAWHEEQAGEQGGDGFGFRRRHVRLVMHDQHGGESRFLVATRWLRRSGLHFLHGGFLHLGVRCTAWLPLSPAETMAVPGTVVGCRHVTGRVHEIEMHFKEELHGGVFRLLARSRVMKPLSEDEIRTLAGTVLCVDGSEEDRGLLAEAMRLTRATLTSATDAKGGIERLKSGAPDAILMELDLPDMPGETFIERARRRCKDAPFIVLTGVEDRSRLQKSVDAGALDIVFKPFTTERLFTALGRVLPRVEADDQGGDDVIDYRSLRFALTNLLSALGRRDFENVLRASRAILAFAKDVQRDSLDEAANEAVEALERARAIAGTTPLLERLAYEARETLAENDRSEQSRAA